MRKGFIGTLEELAARDRRIMLLTGDVGYTVLEPFAARFPDRFINAGVAEQNMVGVATGLAEAGFLPFVYTIGSFAVLRPFEFIRNGPIAQRLPVRMIAVGGGVEYGTAGASHHLSEDLALLRTQADLVTLAPADTVQAGAALDATWNLDRPVYYRLGKSDLPPLPGLDGRFRLGHLEDVRDGRDVLLLALGPSSHACVDAAERLAAQGISAAVSVAACLNPAPAEDLACILGRFKLALSVEAHHVDGGLGSLASEVIAERGLPCRLIRCGLRAPVRATGSQAWLEQQHGLDAESLAEAVRRHVIHR